jgi:tRNA A-37 threonylcarbamoyl transferase component Bud32
MSEWIGKTLGKVHIDLMLARGGTAEVYLGTHTTLQNSVAIKMLRNQYQGDPALLERFQREAQTVARLRHPNIVQVYDFDLVDGQPYLVMEYIPGVSLATYLRILHQNNQRLELPMVDRLLTALAGALQYAHESSVIHRDIKPSNILLTSRTVPVTPGKMLPADVEPVLMDFGLVRFMHSSKQTSNGLVVGTPAYMSPEQARGDPIDARTDIYSLGIVLYEILAGSVPFEADSTMGLLLKHINEPPPPIPGLPPELQQVIDTALAKNPADRFQTPNELANAFKAVVGKKAEAETIFDTLPATLQSPGSGAKRILPSTPTRTRAWFGVGAGIVLLAAAAVYAPRMFNQAPVAPAANMTMPAGFPTIAATMNMPAVALDSVGTLKFEDASAHLDESFLSAKLAALPNGKQYEAWLVGNNGESRISLGVLKLDETHQTQLLFDDPQHRNLLNFYDHMQITIEPNPDDNPNPSGDVAYSSGWAPGALVHIKHLVVAMPDTPGQIGLIYGLYNNVKLVNDAAQAMQTAAKIGDDANVRLNAEAIVNLISGKFNTQTYGDLNGDGVVTDPGDGYGLLQNGSQVGYIAGVADHAALSAAAPDATDNIKLHSSHVIVTAQNLEAWAPQLRDLCVAILQSPPGTNNSASITKAAALADKLMNGIDINNDGQVDPVAGEGATLTAYEHSYFMATMPILTGANQMPPVAK